MGQDTGDPTQYRGEGNPRIYVILGGQSQFIERVCWRLFFKKVNWTEYLMWLRGLEAIQTRGRGLGLN